MSQLHTVGNILLGRLLAYIPVMGIGIDDGFGLGTAKKQG